MEFTCICVFNYCKVLYSAATYMQLFSEGQNSFEEELGIIAMKLCSRKRNHCEVVEVNPQSALVLPGQSLASYAKHADSVKLGSAMLFVVPRSLLTAALPTRLAMLRNLLSACNLRILKVLLMNNQPSLGRLQIHIDSDIFKHILTNQYFTHKYSTISTYTYKHTPILTHTYQYIHTHTFIHTVQSNRRTQTPNNNQYFNENN